MARCVACPNVLTGNAELCPHHGAAYGDDWAVANRIICDLIHRKKFPARLSKADRDDNFWSTTGDQQEIP